MSSIYSNFSITRIGTHIKLVYTVSTICKTALWPANNVSVHGIGNDLFDIGVDSEKISLNYTQSTTPTANTLDDYIGEIQALLNTTDLSLIEPTNSTTTSLGSNATFVGEWVSITNFSEFSCLISTDQVGSVTFDYSDDKISIDRTKTTDYAEYGGTHTEVCTNNYLRVTITNGSISQTFLRAQTILNEYNSSGANMNQIVSDQIGVQIVRDPSIPEWDLARQFYTGRSSEYFHGYNNSVGTIFEDIWPNGGDYPFQTSASIMDITCTSVEDNGYSTGVLTLSGQPSNCDTMTIGTRTYTFQDTLSDVDGNIHISSSPATAAGTILNILGAITGDANGEGSGTGYATSMTIHGGVTGVDGAGDTIDITSTNTYALANDGDSEVIPTTETGVNLSFGAAAMVHKLGCHTVEVHGLDATGTDTDELVVLNGTTTVQTVNSYIRINKMHCQTVGSQQGANYDDITLQVTGGGTTLAIMSGFENTGTKRYGHGEAGMGMWTVPLGDVIYITSIEVSIDNNAKLDVMLYESEGCLRNASPYLPRRLIWSVNEATGQLNIKFESYIKVKQLTDLYFRSKIGSSSAALHVKCHFYRSNANSKGK